ncbi:MAG: hypothetical protein HC787_05960 [Nostocaceae cyanobacterium CSU_2_110]|nr:hypothetical protein [Nostocaceae cyanobacterium CSU_2_110]
MELALFVFHNQTMQQLQTVNSERSGAASLPIDRLQRNQNIIGNLEAKKQVKFLDSTKHAALIDLIDDADYVDVAAKIIKRHQETTESRDYVT